MRRAIALQLLAAVTCVFVQSEARAGFMSYINPAKISGKDAVGNQGYTGSLGMDFRTLDPIKITELGAFDSGLGGFAGLTADQSISVELFNTTTMKAISPVVTFTKKDPGTLVDGSRFKALATPIAVDAGVDLTIVAWGFTKAQPNGNFNEAPYSGMYMGKPMPPWTTNGNSATTGWIGFVGTGRYGPANKPGKFPTTVDNAKGVVNPYAAGTFMWVENATPEPSSFVLAVTGGISLLVTYGWKKGRRALR